MENKGMINCFLCRPGNKKQGCCFFALWLFAVLTQDVTSGPGCLICESSNSEPGSSEATIIIWNIWGLEVSGRGFLVIHLQGGCWVVSGVNKTCDGAPASVFQAADEQRFRFRWGKMPGTVKYFIIFRYLLQMSGDSTPVKFRLRLSSRLGRDGLRRPPWNGAAFTRPN